jgi:hypothetical protein
MVTKCILFLRTYLVEDQGYVRALPAERTNSPSWNNGPSPVASARCSCAKVEHLEMDDKCRCSIGRDPSSSPDDPDEGFTA